MIKFCRRISTTYLKIPMISELLKLGLSTEEARVYLATLEIGGGPVANIAKKAGLHRVSCYHTIEKLEKKQLLSQFIKNKTKYFLAENPTVLKQQALEKVNIATSVLPQLLSLQNTIGFKPKINFFEGEDGVKKVFQKALDSSGEILQFSNIENVIRIFPELFTENILERFKQQRKSRILSPNTQDIFSVIRMNFEEDFKPDLFEVLLVNSDQFFFDNEILIFENSVAIASLQEGEMLGLIVESKSFAKTMKAIFDLAWLGATSFVAS